ncbi:hypothetical protein S7711_06570 [Stachybotrys chartarum IBT 7711]|uniref:Uncharacterized protein n=1 Tax=Stachybotrys chartarum (strain CBS 109288 / IBT 7711) TaxID=1280523 RepID=A0A084AYM3_STACB|nr:hypothetical protein S7711_06570 [Stachybotrys chartarum IBT 7711]KFA50305.1 hypothetical protein S40293_03353 [Stachybotrys chartarum IBT 40293]KFA78347.1 hypothetical protein S40288_05007 [Stachybotrys chartarum IBT 40288]
MNIDTIIGFLLDRTTVEVDLVRITEATENAYNITIETRVSGTGPISSTVSPMHLDLAYNGTRFAKMHMPEITTRWRGTEVKVREQKVEILDMATYKDYVRSVMVAEHSGFQLENGVCTITALGITIPCTYRLRIPIRGMMGPAAALTKVERREGDVLAVTVKLSNPSPVELDHGLSIFEFRNMTGHLMGTLKGDVKIVRGDFEVQLEGKLEKGITPTDKARLVGKEVEGDTWCNETIKYIDLVVDVTPEVQEVLSEA